MPLPTKVSESVRRLNPHLFGQTGGNNTSAAITGETASEIKPRMRQNRGPKMNKTEAAFEQHLQATFASSQIEREGVTLLLANGVRYTADFAMFNDATGLTLWEVKGKHAWEDAIVKLKVAAARFPKIAFYIASPRKDVPGLWNIELVYP